MGPGEFAQLRQQLELPRSVVARFLCVSEMTIVRWEADAPAGGATSATTPHGLALVVLNAIAAASAIHGVTHVARVVRDGVVDHAGALRAIFNLAAEPEPRTKR